GGFRSFSDIAATSEIVKGDVRVDLTAFVKQLIEVAIGEQPPVQAPAGPYVWYRASDRGRAVLRQSVVPLWMICQPIHFVQEIDQQRLRLRGRDADSIQIYLLAAVVRSQS